MKKGVDYIGVGVGAIIQDGQGRLFMARRADGARNEHGRWEFPGGAVEFGETIEHALKREIKEEFGIEIEICSLLDVVDHILPREGQHWVSPTFVCRLLSGTPVIREPQKCDAIGWFSPGDVPGNLSQATQISLRHYLEKTGGRGDHG
jgi:mutator protein MutT